MSPSGCYSIYKNSSLPCAFALSLQILAVPQALLSHGETSTPTTGAVSCTENRASHIPHPFFLFLSSLCLLGEVVWGTRLGYFPCHLP